MSADVGRTRVVLVDDHPIVLGGLEKLLGIEPDFEVVASCRDGAEALQAVAERRPDLVILDLRLPAADGLEVLEALQREPAPPRVLLLTAAVETRQIVAALRLGARGLVLKETAPEVVVEASRRIVRGGTWFDEGLLARAAEGIAQSSGGAADAGQAALTPREREIARRVADGKRNREIALELGISEGTVKLHLHHIYDKLQLSGRVELLLHAQKHGF